MHTGTSIFRYDAWNTGFNDEIGYYNAVVTMREVGLPVGVNSYNEVQAEYPTYGAYNYLTYIPLFIASLVTGWTGHNMIVYANVLIMVLAYGFVVLILRPSIIESIGLTVMTLFNYCGARYTWSGMNEIFCCFLSVVTVALTIWLIRDYDTAGENRKTRKREKLAFVILVLIIFVGGLIRPFMLSFILFPIIIVCMAEGRKWKKAIRSVELLLIAVISLVCFLWMNSHICAPYFIVRTYTPQYFFDLMIHGKVGQISRDILLLNKQAAQFIWQKFKAKQAVGIVLMECMLLCVLIIISFIRYGWKDRFKGWFSAVFLLVCIAFYEANITMYNNLNQLHRMILPLFSSSIVFLSCIAPEKVKWYKKTPIMILGIMVFTAVFFYGKGFGFPQKTGKEPDEAALTQSLAEAFPSAEADVWENTIATSYIGIHYMRYCMPSYLGFSICKTDYLVPAITNYTIKSHYVLAVDSDESVTAVCRDSGYVPVWADYGFTIYKVMPPLAYIGITAIGDSQIQVTMIDNGLNAGPEYSYAWYVYYNGKKLEKYCRGYSADPKYDLILEEDGEYVFRLFMRNMVETKAQSSFAVVVHNGVIVDDPKLERISEEEYATRQTMPEVEVGVTLVGNGVVKLTMVDNTLNAGTDYTYAWYVYRNGEHIKEYDRWYDPDPEYNLALEENGDYSFKLFYQINDVKKSVMSDTISVCIDGNQQEAA